MQYQVTYNANARPLTKPSSITVDAKTLRKWTKEKVEIGFTPSGGHKILKRNNKFVPSGQGSISESITGTKRLRRVNAKNANDYRRAAYRIPIGSDAVKAKPARKTTTRKPAKAANTISIKRDGQSYSGTPADLRKLFGI
jgi:hypothetical protein